MSYPASVATVAVTATYTYSDGAGTIPTGSVTFQPNTVLQDATDSRIIDVKPLVATLDAAGHIAVTLMNTSDTDLTPAGWAYTVTERVAGAQRQYDVFVTGPGPVDLSTLAPVSSTPQYGYVLTTAVGAPGGVASLDGGGQVPLSQLGNAPGGSSVASVNGHTGVVVLGASDVGAQPADADLTTIAGLTPTTDNVIQSVASAWASRTPAQLKATLALAKGDVGLGNVDNTSDVNKPVSTAQAAADAAVAAAAQPLDSDLTAYAALAAAGFVVRTGAGTVSVRTLTGSSETGVTNGDGVAGNPTLTVTAVAPTASAVGDTVVNGGVATHRHARESFGSAPATTEGIGTAAAAGAATTPARSDHVHPMAAAATPTTSAVGDAAATGAATTFAASNHVHGREAFAAPTGQNQGAGTAGAAATVPRSDHAHPYDLWSHLDHVTSGAWTMDPATLAGQTQTTPVAGTIYGAKLIVPTALAGVTSIWMHIITAGSGLTANQCLCALFDSGKNLLQTSADQSVAWTSGGLKQMTITSAAVAAAAAYVCWFFNGTTGPRWHAGGNGVGAVNFNLSAANSRFFTADTGRTTTMPGTLGAFTASNNALWAAIS